VITTSRCTAGARRLGWIGLALLLTYVPTNFVVPLSPAYLGKARAILLERLPLWSTLAALVHIEGNLALVAAVVPAAIAAPLCYLAAVRYSRGSAAGPIAVAVVAVVAALSYLAYVAAPPTFSYDIYMYILQSRVFTVYHANPYATPPAAFAGDPSLAFADPNQIQLTVPYGPVWTYVAIACTFLAGNDIIQQLLGFRLMLLGVNLANLALIWHILGRIRPGGRLAGLVVYAWNPIVAIKGQEHSDSITVLFVLLSIWLALRGNRWSSLAALTASALCKFVTGPLVVVELLALARRSVRTAVIGAALVLGLTVLAFLPVWDGWGMLARLARDPTSAGYDSVFTPWRLLATPGLLVVIGWAGWRAPETVEGTVWGWTVVLLWFSLFLAPSSYLSYLLPLVALASLTDSAVMAAMVLGLCLAPWLNEMAYFARPALVFPTRLFEASRLALPLGLGASIGWSTLRQAASLRRRVASS
jgi:hypothetical protein